VLLDDDDFQESKSSKVFLLDSSSNLLLFNKNFLKMKFLGILFFVIITLSSNCFCGFSDYDELGKNCSVWDQKFVCGTKLACQNHTCMICELNRHECFDYPMYYCKQHTDDPLENECVHKNLFPYFTLNDIFSSILCAAASSLCSASGVGGGGLFIPILLLVGDFSPQISSAISSATIFGGSFSNVIIYSFQKHPELDRPLIEYSVIILLIPLMFCGAVVGVYLNVMFPYWLTLIFLVILLGITAIRTFQNGVKTYRKETKKFKEQDEKETQKKIEEFGLELEPIENTNVDFDEHSMRKSKDRHMLFTDEADEKEDDDDEEQQLRNKKEKELTGILKREASRFPWFKLIILGVTWVIVLLSSILKGSKGVPSIIPDVKECSTWYWIISFSYFPLFGLLTLFYAIWLRRRYVRKLDLGYTYVHGEIHWKYRNILGIPIICFFAGIMSGMLGIGGGMITNPMLVELGLNPKAATATSSFMILFTASVAVVEFFVMGELPWDYGLWFAAIGLVSSLFGMVVIERLSRKCNRTSWLVIFLSVIIGISLIFMTAVGIYNVTLDFKFESNMGFKPIC